MREKTKVEMGVALNWLMMGRGWHCSRRSLERSWPRPGRPKSRLGVRPLATDADRSGCSADTVPGGGEQGGQGGRGEAATASRSVCEATDRYIGEGDIRGRV